jgi:hypothetical protein
MNRLHVAFLCLVLSTSISCARTVYTNLHPQLPAPKGAPKGDRSSPVYWRHFFIYGWAPTEVIIDAADYCGGADRIERIETGRSFAQGLVATFAGYYINIYSPYTGRIICDRHAQIRE